MSLHYSPIYFVLITTLLTPLAVSPAFAGADDTPYSINDRGEFDWYTFNGYRRYHSECHVCHGPAGNGSSFAPNLTKSVKVLGYEGFLETVINGRTNVTNTANKSMPSFASNMNVMCFVDDIYAYLSARSDGVLDHQRPKKQAKSDAAKQRDSACLPQ